MKLTDKDKQKIVKPIQTGKTLPYYYKPKPLYTDLKNCIYNFIKSNIQ